jgi:hypothetical protein
MATMSKLSKEVLTTRVWRALLSVIVLSWAAAARCDVIFDVFVGYGLGVSDSAVADASWFPITCEIQNNGPGFNAVVEITPGQFGNGQTRFMPIELPSNTKKRFIIPVYCTSRYRMSIDARLRTDRGKLIAEHVGLEPRTVVDWQSPLIASLSRTHGGAAALPEGVGRNSQLRPTTTHLSTEFFPDNPLVLEGVDTLYLHSFRALDLKVPQVNALLAWVHGGGNLILAIEQPGEVNALEWLKNFLPCEVSDVMTLSDHRALQDWVQQTKPGEEMISRSRIRGRPGMANQAIANPFTQLSADDAFESTGLQIVTGRLRDGKVLIGTPEKPLAISAARGRGRVTVLMFSPELEPLRSWKNRSWMWAKLASVPMEWLASINTGGMSTMPLDGVFGAMVDSRQIRKLPIGWLLLLLLAYLVVIGPLDQYWLKKINRQMLTWITFPTYVVLFSGLIYLIGYKLRSGEIEWNELHVVDVTPHGDRADLRGRTYGSAYSPANAKYSVACEQPFATLRGEIGSGVAQEVSKATIEQRGNSFAAELSVPVWTSQLFVNDWWRQSPTPLNVTITPRADGYDVSVQNPSGKKIPQAMLIIEGRSYSLGDLTKGKTATILRGGGSAIQALVQNQVNAFSAVVQERQRQFGSQQGGRIADTFSGVLAASFLAAANPPEGNQYQQYNAYNRFVTSPGFDLSPLMYRGDAILLAWMPGETLVPTINKFSPRYSRKDTVLRILVQSPRSNVQGQ